MIATNKKSKKVNWLANEEETEMKTLNQLSMVEEKLGEILVAKEKSVQYEKQTKSPPGMQPKSLSVHYIPTSITVQSAHASFRLHHAPMHPVPALITVQPALIAVEFAPVTFEMHHLATINRGIKGMRVKFKMDTDIKFDVQPEPSSLSILPGAKSRRHQASSNLSKW